MKLIEKKIHAGFYEINGWSVRKLTQDRWRATRNGERIQRRTLNEIKAELEHRADYEIESI